MQFWKSLAIGLAILLGISYVGFAYVYSQVGGIMIAGMVTGGQQPKVVTLLKNSNITFTPGQVWNASVEVFGYKTGVLYYEVFQQAKFTYIDNQGYERDRHWWIPSIDVWFETDDIRSRATVLFERLASGSRGAGRIEITGTRIWIRATAPQSNLAVIQEKTSWVIMSMSLYLRD